MSFVEPGAELHADQVRLQQIVANLLSNAVKFTPSGGRVMINAEIAGANLQITVKDTGDGIDQQLLTAIFEPFRQADSSSTRRHGGLGLGLAIVRQLVLAHGGSVKAESEGKGLGSTFTVELPTGKKQIPATLHGDSTHQIPRLSGTRILVVDDLPDALDLVSEILLLAGAVVQTARSANEALEQMQIFRPDVLVSDIGLPTMDGHELMRHIRRLPADSGGQTPAVALTAYAAAEPSSNQRVVRSTKVLVSIRCEGAGGRTLPVGRQKDPLPRERSGADREPSASAPLPLPVFNVDSRKSKSA